MDSFFHDLYFGPFSVHCESRFSPECNDLFDKLAPYIDKLEGEHGSAFVGELWDAFSNLSMQEQTEAFQAGIRFAFQLMAASGAEALSPSAYPPPQ